MIALEYEGTDITADVSIARAWHDSYVGGRLDHLEIACADTRGLWDKWGPQQGDRLKVSDGCATTGQLYAYDAQPRSSLMVIKATSAPLATVRERRSKSWEQVMLLQLVGEVAMRHGLSYECYGITDHRYAHVEQDSMADLPFLAKRCELEGATILCYDGKLIVCDGLWLDSQTPEGGINVVPGQNYAFSSNEDERYGSCEVTDGRYRGTFRVGDGKTLYVTIGDRISDQEEADRFARGLLRQKNMRTRTLKMRTDTLLRQYSAGSAVEINATAAASWNGPAVMEHVRHDYVHRRSVFWAREAITDY